MGRLAVIDKQMTRKGEDADSKHFFNSASGAIGYVAISGQAVLHTRD
jgi:hypothetical protein